MAAGSVRKILAGAALLALTAAVGFAVSREPWAALLGVALFVGGLIALLDTKIAIFFFVGASFFENLLPAGLLGFSAIRLLGFVVVGSWILRRALVRDQPPLQAGWPESLMGLFFAALAISLLVAPDQVVAREFLIRYAMFLGLTFLVTDQIRTFKEAALLAWVVTVAGGAAAVVGLSGFLGGGELRAQGPLSDPNDLAFALLFALAVGSFLIVQQRGGSRALLVAMIAVIVAGIGATLSRGALVGAAAGALWAAVVGRVRIRHLVAASIVAFGAVVVLYALAPEQISFALELKQNYDPVTVGQRLDRWRVAVDMFASNPLTGVGVGQYGVLFLQFGGTGFLDYDNLALHHVAHNMYLEVVAETGLLGLIPFLALFGLAVWLSIDSVTRLRRRASGAQAEESDRLRAWLSQAQGASVALVALLVASMFLSEQYFVFVWVALALVIAINRAVRDLEKGGAFAVAVGGSR